MELLDNLSQFTTALTMDNESLRSNLNSVNRVNSDQVQVQVDQVRKTQEDLSEEHVRHEAERQTLLRKNDELSTRSNQQETEIARLNQVLAQLKDETTRRNDNLLAQIRSLRAVNEADEEVMDVPDGRIQFVDYGTGTVRTDITRAQGAQPRLTFAVFDRNSAGIPTDKPKATITLTRVTDTGSEGRIVKTNNPSDPIRYNDYVYSAAWDANRPQRFALIGKIDMDRNGRDDREDLKRLIRAAGGEIDYDLPPTGLGSEMGEISALTSWYVIDKRDPIRTPPRANQRGIEDKAFLDKRSDALKLASANGVRPISIERLLAQLGYAYGTPVRGRVEVIDPEASRELGGPQDAPHAAEARRGLG